jgi:hypothetical protein
MSILRPDHLLEQALRLINPPSSGPPRQADIRRAISSAYYAVFHCTMTALADEFIGKSQRSSPRYALVYRSIDHRALRGLCIEVLRPSPARKYAPYVPGNGFGADIETFCGAATDLQQKRHAADYDPVTRFVKPDAVVAVNTARNAVLCFTQAAPARRKAFLTILLCPPR